MALVVIFAKTEQEINACMQLRWAVFVEEQGVAEHEEMDGKDAQSAQVLATLNGIPVGAARIQYIETYAKIQRMCVTKDHRGHGIGANIINFIVTHVTNTTRCTSIRLSAQIQALEFYRALGFVEYGNAYLDAGIKHKNMELQLA